MQTDPSFRMTVEDVFSIRGRGTVVTGHVEQGTLKVGDVVYIKREIYVGETVVTGIRMVRKQIQQAAAGDYVGLVLQDIRKDDVQRGDVMTEEEDEYGWS